MSAVGMMDTIELMTLGCGQKQVAGMSAILLIPARVEAMMPERSSLTRAFRGHQSIGYFPLDRDMLAKAAGMMQQEFDHQRAGGLIGQIGHQLPGPVADGLDKLLIQSSLFRQTVTLNQRDSVAEVGPPSGCRVPSSSSQAITSAPASSKASVKAPVPGPTSRTTISSSQFSRIDQSPDLIGIMQKVLSQSVTWGQSVGVQQCADI